MSKVIERCREIASRIDKCKGCTKCKDGPKRFYWGGWCFDSYAFRGCVNYIGAENMARIELAKEILKLEEEEE